MALPLPVAELIGPPSRADDVPTDIRPAVRFGVAVLLASFGALFLWSAVAPLAKGVVAGGSVVVDSNRKSIQHLEGGIVAEILVRNGDVVAKDQVLVRLDETVPQVSRDILYGQYLALLAEQARLKAERDDRPAVEFPAELLSNDPRHKVDEIRANEEQVFRARRDALAGQLSIYEQRVRQLDQQIAGLKAQIVANAEQARLIDSEVVGLRQLFDKGYASKTRLLALEREKAELDGDRGNYEADSARAAVAIGEARLQIVQLRKNFQEEVSAKLQENRLKLADTADRLKGASDTLARREIRAPQAGVVVNSQVHTVGGVVPPGQTIMEVVPLSDRLIVEVMVSPIDIDSVQAGLEAEVRFPGLPSKKVPILIGSVVSVSADAITDRQGHTFYTARVEVGDEELKRMGEAKLIPGMPAEALIKAGEQTAIEYLLKPLTDSFFRAFRET